MFGKTLIILVLLTWHWKLHVEACHTTKVYIQNGTIFDSRGWEKNEYLDLSMWKTTTTTTEPPTSGSTEEPWQKTKLCVVPNKKQGCLCGGYNKDNHTDELTDTDRKWTAKLKFVTSSVGSYICSGSLINKLFILTAANCMVPTMGTLEQLTAGLTYSEFRGKLTIDVGYHENVHTPMLPDLKAKNIVIKHEKGVNLALVELFEPVDFIPGGVSPICLPPPGGEVVKLDCHQRDPEHPFPMVEIAKPLLICHSEKGTYSSITAFGDVNLYNPSHWIPTCKTNLYGKSIGKSCMSTCSNSLTYQQDDECEKEEVQKRFNKTTFFNPQKIILENKKECFPKIDKKVISESKHEIDINSYGFGWCQTCKQVLDNGTCSADDTEWGFCESKCAFSKSLNPLFTKGEEGAVLHEIAFESYESNPNDAKCTAVKDKEFCSGLSHPPLTFIDDGGETKDGGRLKREASTKNQKGSPEIRKKSYFGSIAEGTVISPASKQIQMPDDTKSTECYGDIGGSVWKKGVFKNSFDESVHLAVLMGVVSRHAERCNMFDRNADNVQVSMHTRISAIETLDWILAESESGKCDAAGISECN